VIRVDLRSQGGLRVDSLASVYVRFWPQLRKSRGMLAGAVVSSLAFTTFTILRPWPLKIVLDYALLPDATVPPPGVLALLSATQIIAAASVAILAIAGLAAVSAYGQRYLGAKAGQTLAYRLRRDLFRHILELSLVEHGRARTGDLILRITGDMNLVRNLLVRATLKLISQMLVLAAVAVFLVRLDWRLALAALAIAPLLFVSASRSSRRIKAAIRQQRRRESEVAATTARKKPSGLDSSRAIGGASAPGCGRRAYKLRSSGASSS